MDIQKCAEAFLKASLQPIPLLSGEKRPAVQNWQKPPHQPYVFRHHNNLGLLTGIKTVYGYFTVIDIDLSELDPVTKAVFILIINAIEDSLSPSVLIKTGGKHQGRHLWYFLNQPLTQKLQITIPLHHSGSENNYGIDIMCQGSQGGYNVVAPPSTVVNEYQFVGAIDIENIDRHISRVKKDDFTAFFVSKRFRGLLQLAEVCSLLNRYYCDGLVSGDLIDMCLSHYILEVLRIKEELTHQMAFKMAFGENFDPDLTLRLFERTAERLETGTKMVGIGSIVEKLKTEPQQKLLQILERTEQIYTHEEDTCSILTPIDDPEALEKSENEETDSSPKQSPLGDDSMFILEQHTPIKSRSAWLIPGIIPAKIFFLLHGFAGIGKTTSAIHIADRVIARTGRPVIYVNLEGKAGDIDEKTRTLSVPKEKLISIRPLSQFSVFDESHKRGLMQDIQKINAQGDPAALIIIDSLMAATSGELNKGKVGGATVFFNEMAEKLDASVLLIHHNNKGASEGQGKIFGSALIAGAVALSFELKETETCHYMRKMVVSKSNLKDLQYKDEIFVGQYPGREPQILMMEDGEELDRAALKKEDIYRNVLLDLLKDGSKQSTEQVEKAISAALQIAYGSDKVVKSTLSKAAKKLGAVYDSGHWTLPQNTLLRKLLAAPEIK